MDGRTGLPGLAADGHLLLCAAMAFPVCAGIAAVSSYTSDLGELDLPEGLISKYSHCGSWGLSGLWET